MHHILGGIIHDFERSTGHKLQIDYDMANLMRDRIRAGEIAVVAIMQRYLLDELLDQSKIVRGSTVDIARSSIEVFERAGGPKPDISSIEAHKTCVAAGGIDYLYRSGQWGALGDSIRKGT